MLEKWAALLQTKLLWVLASAVLITSWIAAIRTADPHWVNRGGALIAAIAAGSVLLQIVLEMGLEKRHSEIENELNHVATPSPDSLLTMERTAQRIEKRRLQKNMNALEKGRLRIVLHVVVCAMLGELLHGFGDLAVCLIASHCAPH